VIAFTQSIGGVMYIVLVGHEYETADVVGPFESLDAASKYQLSVLNFDIVDILEVKEP
jgi:hypothetical protein